jgi:glycosyltransferase involved in cell wall biosynthesis
MRILLVEGSGRGFLNQYSHTVGAGLHARGHEVRLVTGKRNELDHWQPPFARYACLADGVRSWWCLRQHLSQFRPDVVHLQWVGNPLAALWFVRYAQAAGSRVIYTPHNILPHERRWLSMPLFQALYRQVDRVVARDRQLAWGLEELLHTPRTRVVYIPGSPNLLSLAIAGEKPLPELAAPGSGELRLLFFGHGCRRKGLDSLLDTLASRRWAHQLRLVVAGEEVLAGIDPRQLGKAAQSLRITVIDRYIPAEQVTTLFRSVDLLVMPYVKLCKSPLCDLAAALGLPVLRSDRVEAAGFREGVSGITFNHDDAEALAEALERVCRFPGIVRRMRHGLESESGARARIAQLADRHHRLYEDALERDRCAAAIAAHGPDTAAVRIDSAEMP